ncbi:hypothetical protein TNCV_4442231 [Trichonephila clavipes]|nr:hypothetical protein TNCV_4442231 [Trichonephila clavipes]
MSDEIIRKWVRHFNNERPNNHSEAQSGWPSVVNDDLVGKVHERIRENRRSTIKLVCDKFPQTALQQCLSSVAATIFE